MISSVQSASIRWDEVRNLYVQKRRKDIQAWVETFPFLWGLIKGEDQKRLDDLYGFDYLKYGSLTSATLGLPGVSGILISSMNLWWRRGSLLHILLLIPSAYFTLESLIRWIKIRKGDPCGSILGIPIWPFAKRLLSEDLPPIDELHTTM